MGYLALGKRERGREKCAEGEKKNSQHTSTSVVRLVTDKRSHRLLDLKKRGRFCISQTHKATVPESSVLQKAGRLIFLKCSEGLAFHLLTMGSQTRAALKFVLCKGILAAWVASPI